VAKGTPPRRKDESRPDPDWRPPRGWRCHPVSSVAWVTARPLCPENTFGRGLTPRGRAYDHVSSSDRSCGLRRPPRRTAATTKPPDTPRDPEGGLRVSIGSRFVSPDGPRQGGEKGGLGQRHFIPAASDRAMATRGPTVTAIRHERWMRCLIMRSAPVCARNKDAHLRSRWTARLGARTSEPQPAHWYWVGVTQQYHRPDRTTPDSSARTRRHDLARRGRFPTLHRNTDPRR